MNAFKEGDALRHTHVPFKDGNFIHGSEYPWISDPVGKGVEGKLRPQISWGGYPLTHGTGTGTGRCFAP
jgi:hypothetical protein